MDKIVWLCNCACMYVYMSAVYVCVYLCQATPKSRAEVGSNSATTALQVILMGFDNGGVTSNDHDGHYHEGHKHDDRLGEIYPTMLNELNCTFVVSFSCLIAVAVTVMVCGHRVLWPSWLWPSWTGPF